MVLTVNNLTLFLKWTPTGPLLSTQDKYLEPLAWIINPAVTGRIPDFADKLARGEDISMVHRFAARPEPDEILPQDHERWKELTGSELGEDVYMVGTTFLTHGVILPRQTLQEIFQALLKKRAEFPEPPFPWLFRLEPYHLTPTEGEEELVGKLEERARALKQPSCETVAEILQKRKELLRDLSEAGLFSEEYAKEKQLWLEEWEYSTLLFYHRGAMKFIKHIRQMWPAVEPELVLSVSISIEVPKQAHHSTEQAVYSQLAPA